MAINVSQFVTEETTDGGGTLLDDLAVLNPLLVKSDFLPLATAIADCVGRGLQHIKDNAVALDGTSGGGDSLDID